MASPRICSIPDCGKLQESRGWCNAHYLRWWAHGDPLGGGTFNGEPERFFREVVLPFEGDECLKWPYAKDGKGYGRMWHCGRLQSVARLACEERHGPPPTAKHETAHSCGKGHEGCVNHKHLRWATRKENHADKIVHGTSYRGERHSATKLTEKDVQEIRMLRGKASQREIAAQFGVVQSNISQIQRGASWAWLD